MVSKIISGGQTGADLGGLLGARDAGVQTGGTAPPGYWTERGSRFHLLKPLGLVEGEKDPKVYPKRTLRNVLDSDGTALFGNTEESGTHKTLSLCKEHKKPYILNPDMYQLVAWIKLHNLEVVNIAGNRESVMPGIENSVRVIVRGALNYLRENPKEELVH